MVDVRFEDGGEGVVWSNHPFSRLKGLKKLFIDDVLVGAVDYEASGDEMVLRVLYIVPELRKKGYGCKFLEWLEDEARRSGKRWVVVRAGGSAPPIYRNSGYVLTREGWVKNVRG